MTRHFLSALSDWRAGDWQSGLRIRPMVVCMSRNYLTRRSRDWRIRPMVVCMSRNYLTRRSRGLRIPRRGRRDTRMYPTVMLYENERYPPPTLSLSTTHPHRTFCVGVRSLQKKTACRILTAPLSLRSRHR